MTNREQLKTSLPYGAVKEIAQKLNVTSTTVSRFLNGHSNNKKVEIAVLEYLVEIETKKKELYQALRSI